MTRVAYIAGPVTGKPDENRPAFEAARLVVAEILGLERRMVNIPHDFFWPGYLGGEAKKMEVCLGHICRHVEQGFDLTVVCLPGWRDSLGSLVEVALARKLGVPVVELVGEELRPVLLSPDNTNEGPRCANSNEPSKHREPKEGSTDA